MFMHPCSQHPKQTTGHSQHPAGSLCPFWVVTNALTSSSKCVLSVCFRTEQEFSSKTVPITGAVAGSLTCLPWLSSVPISRDNPAIAFPGIISQPNIHPQIFISVLASGNLAKTSNVLHVSQRLRTRPDPKPGLPDQKACTTLRERVPSVSPAVPRAAWGQAGQPIQPTAAAPYRTQPWSVILTTRPGIGPQGPGGECEQGFPSKREGRVPFKSPHPGFPGAGLDLSQPPAGPSSLK